MMKSEDYQGSELGYLMDGNPKYASNSTKEWLKKRRWTVLNWPAMSPDPNPIDLWRDLNLPLGKELEHISREEQQKLPADRYKKVLQPNISEKCE